VRVGSKRLMKRLLLDSIWKHRCEAKQLLVSILTYRNGHRCARGQQTVTARQHLLSSTAAAACPSQTYRNGSKYYILCCFARSRAS
jgi:hypothetical protein